MMMMMMMLLLRFFRSFYPGETGADEGCGITVALFFYFFFFLLEGGRIVRIVWH